MYRVGYLRQQSTITCPAAATSSSTMRGRTCEVGQVKAKTMARQKPRSIAEIATSTAKDLFGSILTGCWYHVPITQSDSQRTDSLCRGAGLEFHYIIPILLYTRILRIKHKKEGSIELCFSADRVDAIKVRYGSNNKNV